MEDWRDWDRKAAADPEDYRAATKACEVRERAGLPPIPELEARRCYPARSFSSTEPFDVWVELLDGSKKRLASLTPNQPGIEIPLCRRWWLVAPLQAPDSFTIDPNRFSWPKMLETIQQQKVHELYHYAACDFDTEDLQDLGGLRRFTLIVIGDQLDQNHIKAIAGA